MAERKPAGTARARTKRARLTTAESERIFNRLTRARPLCTEGDIARVDHELAYGPVARDRRVALTILTHPGMFVVDFARKDRDNAVSMADGVLALRQSIKIMRELADLMELAEWRLAVALCDREDMRELYAEAKAAGEAEASASSPSGADRA